MDKRSITSAINGKKGGRPRELKNFKALPDENWRPVKGFTSYFVSDLGRVVSVKSGKPKIRKQVSNGNGYYYVSLNNSKAKDQKQYIHRLVLKAFEGNPPPKSEASHLNGIKDDNRFLNLKWESRSANHQRKLEHGTMPNGTKHYLSKLKVKGVLYIRKSNHSGLMSMADLAKQFHVSKGTIQDVIERKTWKHI